MGHHGAGLLSGAALPWGHARAGGPGQVADLATDQQTIRHAHPDWAAWSSPAPIVRLAVAASRSPFGRRMRSAAPNLDTATTRQEFAPTRKTGDVHPTIPGGFGYLRRDDAGRVVGLNASPPIRRLYGQAVVLHLLTMYVFTVRFCERELPTIRRLWNLVASAQRETKGSATS
jgi:hypothetical protein